MCDLIPHLKVVGIPAQNIVEPKNAWNILFHAPSINQLKLKI